MKRNKIESNKNLACKNTNNKEFVLGNDTTNFM